MVLIFFAWVSQKLVNFMQSMTDIIGLSIPHICTNQIDELHFMVDKGCSFFVEKRASIIELASWPFPQKKVFSSYSFIDILCLNDLEVKNATEDKGAASCAIGVSIEIRMDENSRRTDESLREL